VNYGRAGVFILDYLGFEEAIKFIKDQTDSPGEEQRIKEVILTRYSGDPKEGI